MPLPPLSLLILLYPFFSKVKSVLLKWGKYILK
jgi:hypothetical protein